MSGCCVSHSCALYMMGVSLSQYRAAIGNFNRCRFVLTCTSISIQLTTLRLFIVLLLLLILCGDVEVNPGPTITRQLKNLNICHANVRSLTRGKLADIKTSLAETFDIITLSETHLNVGIPNEVIFLEGFHEILRKDRVGLGGGIAIFIKDNLTYKRKLKYEFIDTETMWIQ